MKSKLKDLRNRGMVCEEELVKYQKVEDVLLEQMIDSSDAWQRTIAVHILGERRRQELSFCEQLLVMLSKEKKSVYKD